MADSWGFIITTALFAIIINGLASTGPIITTYGGTLYCKDDKVCETDKKWYMIMGVILIIVMLCITYFSISWIRERPTPTTTTPYY